MHVSKVISVAPGATLSYSNKMDFQGGTIIGTVIPVSDDEATQIEKKFKANFKWSVNNKFWITEPICDASTTASSGEALVTTTQGPYVKLDVINMEPTTQKFFVVINVPDTPY